MALILTEFYLFYQKLHNFKNRLVILNWPGALSFKDLEKSSSFQGRQMGVTDDLAWWHSIFIRTVSSKLYTSALLNWFMGRFGRAPVRKESNVQGVPTQTFIFHFALAGSNIQASFGLKVIWESWIADFLVVMTLGFGQK